MDDDIEKVFMTVSRQAFEDARQLGVGWVRFVRLESGEFEVTSVHPKEVTLKEPKE